MTPRPHAMKPISEKADAGHVTPDTAALAKALATDCVATTHSNQVPFTNSMELAPPKIRRSGTAYVRKIHAAVPSKPRTNAGISKSSFTIARERTLEAATKVKNPKDRPGLPKSRTMAEW